MMAIRFPSVLNAKQILRRSNLFTIQAAALSMNVPKGYFAIYVGEVERKQFVIPVSLLNEPSFQELLSISKDEFGFTYPADGLIIPCREDTFISLTSGLL